MRVHRLMWGSVAGCSLFLFAALPVVQAASSPCSVGERILAEPGDRPGTVTGMTAASCRVHFDDASGADDWVQVYSLKAAASVARDARTAASGPRIGRYNITVGAGFYDGYLMLTSPTGYELFLPGGKSAGTGQFAYNSSEGRIGWVSGPMTNLQWDGTQKIEAAGNLLKVRIGKRAVATNSAH
jgi:hypothetical protein